MKDDQNKEQDQGEKLLNEIKSVPKLADEDQEYPVDDEKRPAKGGSRGAKSDQDGGQSVGSSAGSH